MAINATGGDAPYDLTNVTSVDNILEFVQAVNDLTGQYFMLGMLLAGFVIMFVTTNNGEPKDRVLNLK